MTGAVVSFLFVCFPVVYEVRSGERSSFRCLLKEQEEESGLKPFSLWEEQ